jgi:BirA family biotin operon repressor/biotin-[acetyl-CoA-carboxylase] ligase
MPDLPANLTAALAATRFGPLEWTAEIDSTNARALTAAADDAGPGLVVVADHQTAGRGRLDRRWESLPGASLLVSILLRPVVSRERWPAFVTAGALAMAEAIEQVSAVACRLKWPNDLIAVGSGRKLAGVLAESNASALVVGLGGNVDWFEVPEPLTDIATAINLEGGRPTDRADLLAAFLSAFDHHLDDLDRAIGVARSRSATVGRAVRVQQSTGDVVGTAEDLGPSGELLVRTADGALVAVTVGDVTHLRYL